MLKKLITDIARLFKMFESRKGSRKSNKKVVVHRVQYMKNETFSIYFVKITEATYLNPNLGGGIFTSLFGFPLIT